MSTCLETETSWTLSGFLPDFWMAWKIRSRTSARFSAINGSLPQAENFLYSNGSLSQDNSLLANKVIVSWVQRLAGQ
jgi:hypothetical protein